MNTFRTSLREQLNHAVLACRNMDRRTLLLSLGGVAGAIVLVSSVIPNSPTHVTKVVANAQNVLAAPKGPPDDRSTTTTPAAPDSPRIAGSSTTVAPHEAPSPENPHANPESASTDEAPLPTVVTPSAPSVPTAVPTSPPSPRGGGTTAGGALTSTEVPPPASTPTSTPTATTPSTTKAPAAPTPPRQDWTSIQTSPGDPTIGVELNPFAARGQFYVSTASVQIDGEPEVSFSVRTPPTAACSSTNASRSGSIPLTSFTKSPGTYRVTTNVTLTSCADRSTHSVIETHMVQVFFPS